MSETDNLETGAKDAEVDAEEQVEPYIIEQHNYFDETGRVVMENRLVSGTRPGDQPEFVGHGKLTATAPPPIGNAEATFAFEIAGAESVEDAFAKFDAAIEEKKPKYLQEFRELIQQQVMAAREAASQIVTAQGIDLADLQMPGGNGSVGPSGPRFRL
jgi:hypothetical protein